MQDFMSFFHFLIFAWWGSKKVGHEIFFSLGHEIFWAIFLGHEIFWAAFLGHEEFLAFGKHYSGPPRSYFLTGPLEVIFVESFYIFYQLNNR